MFSLSKLSEGGGEGRLYAVSCNQLNKGLEVVGQLCSKATLKHMLCSPTLKLSLQFLFDKKSNGVELKSGFEMGDGYVGKMLPTVIRKTVCLEILSTALTPGSVDKALTFLDDATR